MDEEQKHQGETAGRRSAGQGGAVRKAARPVEPRAAEAPQTPGAAGRGASGGAAAGPFGAWSTLDLPGGARWIAGLRILARETGRDPARLPYSIRVLLENALRHCGRGTVEERDVLALLDWDPIASERPELAFMPGRVLLQDLTGVPCVVDLAAMRAAVARRGGDPAVIDPSVPVDLVIDHSLQVDHAGIPDACRLNMELETARNGERYALLRWAQGEFARLRIVPPGTGICHQVNLEYLAEVVRRDGTGSAEIVPRGGADSAEMAPRDGAGGAAALPWAYPDTVIGTDSHTTMINGLGVLGWGVGGIEAEAVMLGQPYPLLVPQVVGVRLAGRLAPEATATDLVLTLTELLRSVGVVGRFVEYFGPGAAGLSLADRATVANMSPEYGATCGFFPVDAETVAYLRATGRPEELCSCVETYCRAQSLFREPGSSDPEYSRVVELDLAEVRPSLAGPRRPQDRVQVEDMPRRFEQELPVLARGREGRTQAKVELDGKRETVRDGDVVIASITSCTNTSNPALMLAAGLLARKAVALGLAAQPWVRTSLAPGSRAVTGYLAEAGLLEPLEALGFGVVGYGCATCIGNSGPLDDELARAIKAEGLVVAAVLSGNRNFEGRIHPLVRASYLASPALVVAYALVGTVDIDLTEEPLGLRSDGRPVYLHDLWPSADELARLAAAAVRPELFRAEYERALEGTDAWRRMAVPQGALFEWDPSSTYIQEPPFLAGVEPEPAQPSDVRAARVLAMLGDSMTTDHISPAGSIAADSPAGRYLAEHGVAVADFNTYGARRGNHEVLMRGTFGNQRLRNRMAPDREGGWTTYYPGISAGDEPDRGCSGRESAREAAAAAPGGRSVVSAPVGGSAPSRAERGEAETLGAGGEVTTIYDAAMRYKEESVPLVVFAGKEYGTGSSRDWAAKGPALLGVRVVIAESFERIHRSNLVGMGVLPVELEAGVTVESLGLTGAELVDIEGMSAIEAPGARVTVRIRRRPRCESSPGTPRERGEGAGDQGAGGTQGGGKQGGGAEGSEPGTSVTKDSGPAAGDAGDLVLSCRARLDSMVEVRYFRHGGLLPFVFRAKLDGRA